MKIIKFLWLVAFPALFSNNIVLGQQVPIISQYMFNELSINPAYAGSTDYTSIRGINRNQWVGIPGAPVTQMFSINGLVDKYSLGLGGLVFNDEIGPSRETGIQTSYAYHIKTGTGGTLSLGIQAGVFQYSLDPNLLTFNTPGDKTQITATESSWVPEASFGAYYYGEDYYIGFSVPNAVSGSGNLSSLTGSAQTEFTRNYMVHAGYAIDLGSGLQLEPSFLLRTVQSAPIGLDINTKLTYQKTFWIGVSYRTQDAVVVMLGFSISQKFYFGYSYDIPYSDLAVLSQGSQEIMLGYDFGTKKTKN